MSLKNNGTEVIGFKFNGMEAVEAKLNGVIVWKKAKEYIDTEFTVCPFPTSWTEVTTRAAYTASNDYGTWGINATAGRTSSYSPNKAFDSNGDTVYSIMPTNSANSFIEIESPVLIKPAKVYLHYKSLNTTSFFQGYNPTTEQWETLHTLLYSTSEKEENITISTANFYTKFRIYNSAKLSYTPYIYEIQINSGTIRQV